MSLYTRSDPRYIPPSLPPIVNTGSRKANATGKEPTSTQTTTKKTWESVSNKTYKAVNPNFPPLKATTTPSTAKTPTTTKVTTVASTSIQTDGKVERENPWQSRKQQNEIANIFQDLRD